MKLWSLWLARNQKEWNHVDESKNLIVMYWRKLGDEWVVELKCNSKAMTNHVGS